MRENDLRFNQGRWEVFWSGQWVRVTDPQLVVALAPYDDWQIGGRRLAPTKTCLRWGVGWRGPGRGSRRGRCGPDRGYANA